MMKNSVFNLAVGMAVVLGLGGALPLYAQLPDAKPSHEVIAVQMGVQDVLLQMQGVKYVTTGSCEEDTGELVTGLSFRGPLMDCIAVRFKTASDIATARSVFPNMTQTKGVLIHFTLKDTIPNKGGITVHN